MHLDHVIVETSDILAATRALRERGFPEAWPVGPFWPGVLTCGFSVGEFNLELLEPLEREAEEGLVKLVFSPEGPDDVPPEPYDVFVKTESDPALLRLRGFAPGTTHGELCKNAIPTNVNARYFVCEYTPEVAARVHRHRRPTGVRVEVPESWGIPTEWIAGPIRLGTVPAIVWPDERA